eukprot:TRINITY_DN5657_c0_g1_i1.p1 TRINITY_DN5657_c0_g1~~TRINITY_DN5657_c0_g1_i1.p1  ORF type:complete len:383 (+),score=139.73 TRINITY_DN5657_c0_g1_i1:60-1151(+)
MPGVRPPATFALRQAAIDVRVAVLAAAAAYSYHTRGWVLPAVLCAVYVMLRMRRAQREPPHGHHADTVVPNHPPGVVLYNNCFSLCSGQVRLVLAEKGIEYESRHVHLIETGSYETQAKWFIQISPGACVPVMVHGGHPVYQSSSIITYADAVLSAAPSSLAADEGPAAHWFESASMKGDPMQAECRRERIAACIPFLTLPLFCSMMRAGPVPLTELAFGMLFHHHAVRPVMFLLFQTFGVHCFRLPPFRTLVNDARVVCEKHLQRLDEDLSAGGGPFIGGGRYTVADVNVTALLERLRVTRFDHLMQGKPSLLAYWGRMRARPSYKEAMADHERECIRGGIRLIDEWKGDASLQFFRELYGQ